MTMPGHDEKSKRLSERLWKRRSVEKSQEQSFPPRLEIPQTPAGFRTFPQPQLLRVLTVLYQYQMDDAKNTNNKTSSEINLLQQKKVLTLGSTFAVCHAI